MPVERLEVEPARLTLWDIEAAWLELIEARAEAEEIPNAAGSLAAIAACDQAIKEYTEREVAKVDGIRAVVRALKAAMEAAKQERDYQAKRAQSAEAMITRIKAFAQSAMEASGKKRIEGRTGYLSLKGNGGVQALDVTAELVPEDYIDVTVRMPADAWDRISQEFATESFAAVIDRSPSNARIRAALAEPCPVCAPMENHGEAPGGVCPACGGSGRNAVPGARLLERGQHVEIR